MTKLPLAGIAQFLCLLTGCLGLSACEAGQAGTVDASTSLSDAAGRVADATMAAPSPACERYLSCLLVVAPESYAAALVLYGSGSACWANAQQTMNCSQACDSSFSKIESQCSCAGSVCKPYPKLAKGGYVGSALKVDTDACFVANMFAASTYILSQEIPYEISHTYIDIRYQDPMRMEFWQVGGAFVAGKANLKGSGSGSTPLTIGAQIVAADELAADVKWVEPNGTGGIRCTSKFSLTLKKQ